MNNEKLGAMEIHISHDLSYRDSLKKDKMLRSFRYDLLSNINTTLR